MAPKMTDENFEAMNHKKTVQAKYNIHSIYASFTNFFTFYFVMEVYR